LSSRANARDPAMVLPPQQGPSSLRSSGRQGCVASFWTTRVIDIAVACKRTTRTERHPFGRLQANDTNGKAPVRSPACVIPSKRPACHPERMRGILLRGGLRSRVLPPCGRQDDRVALRYSRRQSCVASFRTTEFCQVVRDDRVFRSGRPVARLFATAQSECCCV